MPRSIRLRLPAVTFETHQSNRVYCWAACRSTTRDMHVIDDSSEPRNENKIRLNPQHIPSNRIVCRIYKYFLETQDGTVDCRTVRRQCGQSPVDRYAGINVPHKPRRRCLARLNLSAPSTAICKETGYGEIITWIVTFGLIF